MENRQGVWDTVRRKRGGSAAAEDGPRGVRPPYERPRGWDSAFYRFAESVRELSGGAINYKVVYALVGTNGRYVNHASPIVRKRTAAALSRLMHSSRYAQDLRESYRLDSAVFTDAAASLAEGVRASASCDDRQLFERFAGPVWTEIRRGLESEAEGGRDLNLARVDRESSALGAWCRVQIASGRAPLEELVAACFHMMAFGCLDDRFARVLCTGTPADAADVPHAEGSPRADAACLLRAGEGREAPISGIWRIEAGRPFSIGRYTDCDAIETDPLVSRLHCRIYRIEGAWYVEDPGSSHGTKVLRGEGRGAPGTVFEAGGSRPPGAFRLAYGDDIVLAGRAAYQFRALDERELA